MEKDLWNRKKNQLSKLSKRTYYSSKIEISYKYSTNGQIAYSLVYRLVC